MTIQLYYQDHYMQEFDARVLGINKNELVLDQTCFYPEGGGQIGDTGEIGGVRVIDTQKTGGRKVKVGDIEVVVDADIVHILEHEPPFKVGYMVHGKIDWDRRYRVMRLHSATHVMEYFLFQIFGKKQRLSSYVSDDKTRDEYAVEEKFDKEGLKKVENLCNEFFARNLPIEIRTHQTINGFRYWKCGEVEMACGGTHPKSIGEVGKILLKRSSPGAGKDRVETFLVD